MEHSKKSAQLRSNPEPTAGCSSCHKAAAQKRTASNVADGFLRSRFLPLRDDRHPELENRRNVEREFFNSLSNLSTLFGFEVLPKDNSVYPHNIAQAFSHAERQLHGLIPKAGLAVIKDDKNNAALATYKEYSVGNTLYFIPVRPLWDLLKDRRCKKQSDLLQSVFAYLFQVVEIPLHSQESSYLYSEYEMLLQWQLEAKDLEQDAFRAYASAFHMAIYGGDFLQRKISHPYHLTAFERRLNDFEPCGETAEQLKQVATGFYQLSITYPQRSFWDSIHTGLTEPEVEDRVMYYHYLSFLWDLDDYLAEDLFQSVNMQLQEYGVMDNPVSVQLFDKPQQENKLNLDFEQTLFCLLEDLCELLKIL